MDFNQILLFAGLGLLAMVLLFALWGFLGGLKRELKCIAVFIVLLVLSWLVLGDSATILNAEAGKEVANFLDIKDNSITTVWDAVVAYARTIIPNGESLLVEGKETYDLLFSIASAVCHAVGLLVGTIAVLVICPIIRLITHFIGLIIRLFKRLSANKKVKETATENTPKAKEQVVVPSTESGLEEAIITKDKNEVVKKPVGKRRLWGAFAATLKGVFVVILVCAPLSGLASILNEVSPKTQELINDVISGDAEFKVSQSNDSIDMIFDFAEAYEESALGKFVNASGFFFGESFSESLFDQMLKVETKTQTIYLSDELVAFIDAANAINGKTDLSQLTKKEFSNAIESLKDSKLVVELMPVAIEYAYNVESINTLIKDAKQETAFLNLRYNNWRGDIDAVLDAVKEAYDLDLFPLSDFNYLTINPEELRDVVNYLGSTELMQDALPIVVSVALNMEQVKELVGQVQVSMNDYDVKKELNSIVDIYEKFQIFGITTLDNFDVDAFVKEVLNDEELTDLVFEIVYDVIDLQLMEKLAVPLAFGFAKNNESLTEMLQNTGEYENFVALETEFALADLKVLIETAHIALNLADVTEYPTVKIDYFHFDADLLDKIVDNLFETEVTSKLFNIGVKVAVNLESVKELTNNALVDVDLTGIDWHAELGSVVDIYRHFLELGFESIDDFSGDIIDLVQSIIEDERKFEAVASILDILADSKIYEILAVPAVQATLDKFIDENYVEFSSLLGLADLSAEEWKEDFRTILELAKIANELKVLDNLNPFDYTQLDIASNEGVANIKAVISSILNLNILGSDELKTKLLFASIRQFGWTNLPENVDTITIEWSNEEQVLLQLVDVYKNVNDLEEFDIFNVVNTDWVALLENKEFIDYVVTALEVLIDSDIVLELMPGLLDKYLVPILEGTDVGDDTLFTDILDTVQSEELVNEIIKIITDIVKPALELNLLNAKTDGLGAIDFANTEALKSIIAGIFDSKLIQGFEGRVIRIILNLTGVLKIEKDSDLYNELVGLDYTGEKEVLLSFIDTIAPVLNDPEFSLVDEAGQLKLDLAFWTENQNAKTVLEGVTVLFGSYTDDTYEGSKLIETLLPSLYDKFVEEGNLIPANFQELVEILEVTDASGAEIVNALRCLLYIVDELVSLNAQSLLNPNGGNMEISTEAATQSYCNIIEALHDIELFKGHESETLAWVVNYVADMLSIDLEATVQDFSNVNWEAEQEVYKDIISDITSLLAEKDIVYIADLMEFISERRYTDLINDADVTSILNILDKIIDVEVIDAIAPLFVKYGVKLLDEKGYDVTYINELTNEELAHDFHKFVEIAHKLVDEANIIVYYNAKFAGSISLPNEEVVTSLVDDLFELNVVTKANGRLANMLLEKLVDMLSSKTKFFLTVEDFEAESIDWSTEKEVLKEIILLAYDLLEVNNITTMDDVQNLIKEKWYTYPTMLRDETGYVATDLLRLLQNSQIVGNIIDDAFDYAINQVNESGKLPFDLGYLTGMSKESLLEDLGTIANMLDKAIEFGALRYIADGDIRDMDLDILANIIEQLYELNIVSENEYDLVDTIYNFALNTLETTLKGEFSVTDTQIKNSSLKAELQVIADTVRSLKLVCDAKNIEHSSDFEQILRDASYKQKDFYDEATFDALVEVVRTAKGLHFVELIAGQLVEYGINLAVEKGFNFGYVLDGQYTTELILEDLDPILDIVKHAYDLGLMDYLFDKTLYTIEVEPLCNIIDEATTLNLANLYFHETLTKTLNYLFRKTNIDVTVEESEIANIVLVEEAEVLKSVLYSAKDLLDASQLVSLDDILTFVNNKGYNNAEYFTVEVGNALESLIFNAADLATLEVVLPDLLNVASDMVTVIDLSFLKDSFTGLELAEDIKTISKLIVPAIEADLVGLAFKAPVKELVLNFEQYEVMLDVIQNVNILNKKYSYFAEILLNEALKVLKVEASVTEVECRLLNFKAELNELKTIVRSLSDICAEKSFEKVSDVIDIVNNKLYQRVDFYTVETASSVEAILTSAGNLDTLKVILPEVFDHYVSKVTNLDLSFLVGEFTGEELAEDVKTIAKLVVPAVEADLAKALFKEHYQDIVINFEKYDEMLDILGDMNILNKKYAQIVELAGNKLLEALKIENTISANEFEGISFASEVEVLRKALNGVEEVCYAKEYVTVKDVMDLISQQSYKYPEFYDVATGEGVARFISEIVEAKTVKVMLPKALHYGVNALESSIDLTFLKGEFTGEELAEDVKTIAKLIVPAIEANLNSLLVKGAINELEFNFAKYDEMLDVLSDMNILNAKYPEFASLGVNTLLKSLKTTMTVDTYHFEGISFKNEVIELREVLNAVEELCLAKDYVTVNDIITAVKEKAFTKPEFYDVAMGVALEQVLSSVVDLETVVVMLPKVLNYEVAILSTKYDLSFLKDAATGKELAEDVKTIAKLIVPAIEANLNSLLVKGAINELEFNFAKYDEMLDILAEVNLLENKAPEFVAFLINMLTPKLEIERTITALDCQNVTLTNELETLKSILDGVEQLCQEKSYSTVNDIKELVSDKDYARVSFYTVETGMAVETILNGVASLETLKVVLSDLFDKYVANISDLSFLVGSFSSDELAEDIKTVAKLVVPAIESDAIKALFKEHVMDVEFNFVKYDEMLDILSDMNILNKKYAELAELLGNKVLEKLDISNKLTAVTFRGITFENEVVAIKEVLDNVESLFANKEFVTVRDVRDMLLDEAYKTAEFYDVTTGKALEGILTNVVDIKLVNTLLPYVFDKYIAKVEQLDFLVGESTSAELTADIKTLAKLIVPAIEADLNNLADRENIVDIAFNFAKYDEMLDIVKSVNMFNNKAPEFVELITNYVLVKLGISEKVALSDCQNVNFKEEVETLKNVLNGVEKLFAEKEYLVVRDVIDAYVDKDYTESSFYTVSTGAALEEIISSVVDAETVKVMLPVVFNYAIAVASNKVDLSFLKESLTAEELVQDVKDVAGLIVPAIEADMVTALLEHLVKEYVIDDARVDTILTIVETLTDLNIVRYAPDKLAVAVLDVLKVDTTDVDLANVDWDNEQDVLLGLIDNVTAGLIEYDLTSLIAIKDYIVDNMNNATIKSLLSELKSIYNTIDIIHCVNAIELIDQSDLFDELFKPLYNKYVFDKVSGKLGDAADLTNYTKSDLSDDVHSLAVVARSIYEIRELPGHAIESYDNPECIQYVETIINELFSLNYLVQKKQALVELADKVLPLDLSELDLTDVDLAYDGKVFASYAAQYLLIYKETEGLKLKISQLGITELMSAVVEIYQGISRTDLAQEIVVWGFNEYVLPRICNLPVIENVTFTEDRIVNMFVEFGEVLDAMLDMGVFSNDGIDFTDSNNTDRLFGIIEKYFKLEGKYETVIKTLKENMYEFGIIPLSYAGITNSKEINGYKEAYSKAMVLVRDYKDIVNNYEIIANPNFQQALQDCVEALFKSDIVAQVAPKMLSGLTKIFTKDIVKLHVFDDLTTSEITNVVLPEVFEIVNCANELGIFAKHLDYKNTDAIINLANAIKNSTFIEGHADELLKFALYYIGVDVRDKDFSGVYWPDEFVSFENALRAVEEVLPNVSVSDKSTLLTSEVLNALADAAVYFENSELLPLIGREAVEFVADKFFDGKFDKYVDHLFAVEYKDEALMKDYAYANEALRALADADYFGKGIDYSNLTPYVTLVEIFFELEYSKGMEEIILSAIFQRVEIIKDYEVDYSKVLDWEYEGAAIVAVTKEVEVLATLVDVNNITTDDLHDEAVQVQLIKVIDAISKSVVGQQLFPPVYKDFVQSKFENKDHYEGIVDLENTDPENWASEFEKLFEMYDILSIHGFHDDYTATEVAELVKIMFGDSAGNEGLASVTSDPETWFKKIFDNNTVSMPSENVTIDYENVTDWNQEAQAIVKVVDAMTAFQTDEENFGYENVYTSNDQVALENLLNAVNETESLQAVMYQMVVNAAEDDTKLAETLETLEVNGETFINISELEEDLADGKVDSSIWTEEQIALIAETIANHNAQ